MQQDLTYFLTAGGLPLKILVVESLTLLPQLRGLFPRARIHAVTRMEYAPETVELRGLELCWTLADYRREQLPFPRETFDLLVAADALTEAYEPYVELMALGRLLKGTGTLLTRYRNVRFHGLLAALRGGEFPLQEHHAWAKPEVVRLLNDTLFKEITFAPGEQEEPGPEGRSEGEEEFCSLGFEDFSRDLATRTWLVKADRSTAAVANLKGMYSQDTRKELSRLLHRLEYGVEPEQSLAQLQELCRREQIFPEYVEDFVREACAHQERVLASLAKSSGSFSDLGFK